MRYYTHWSFLLASVSMSLVAAVAVLSVVKGNNGADAINRVPSKPAACVRILYFVACSAAVFLDPVRSECLAQANHTELLPMPLSNAPSRP
jgi:hypothetical protein